MLATVLRAPSAVVVLDEAAGSLRLQPALSREQADDPDVIVLVDHRAAAAYLSEARGKAGEAARAATLDARLALSA